MSQIKPKSVVLDATAGNRMMWAHLPNRDSEYIYFIDNEKGLRIPPDSYMDWNNMPFKKDRFKLVIFDPPHSWFGLNSIHNDPKGIRGRWWGNPRNKANLIQSLIQASYTLSLVAPKMMLKWNETSLPLDEILMLFDQEWVVKSVKEYKSNMKRGKSKTFWVFLVRI